jgi:RNase H-fold protein (predicted Holliday junction resolvase)
MTIMGFDPGRDKCGVAIMNDQAEVLYSQVIRADQVENLLPQLFRQFACQVLVMGNQTTSQLWQNQLQIILPAVPIILLDERYTTAQARQRYWQIYPAQGLTKLIPLGMRSPPRPVDDIVAIILIERYLEAGNKSH